MRYFFGLLSKTLSTIKKKENYFNRFDMLLFVMPNDGSGHMHEWDGQIILSVPLYYIDVDASRQKLYFWYARQSFKTEALLE